ncbi:MAG: hypothetical protein ACXWT1_17925 [Methylobacter sp.]
MIKTITGIFLTKNQLSQVSIVYRYQAIASSGIHKFRKCCLVFSPAVSVFPACTSNYCIKNLANKNFPKSVFSGESSVVPAGWIIIEQNSHVSMKLLHIFCLSKMLDKISHCYFLSVPAFAAMSATPVLFCHAAQ